MLISFAAGCSGEKEKAPYNDGMKAWSKGDYEGSIKKLEEAIKINPNFIPAQAMLGISCLDAQKPELAIKQEEALRKLDKNDVADDLKAVIEKDRLRREADAKSKKGENVQAGINAANSLADDFQAKKAFIIKHCPLPD